MKSKTKTTPIYKSQIEGAANDLTSAYRTAQPRLEQGAADMGDLRTSILDKWRQGDPNITAARGYNADVLSGKYLNEGNPYLQAMIDKTNNSVRNDWQARLGSRGLTGGSDYAGIIARALAENETGLRYNDYGTERNRMDQAAALAPSFVAGENEMLSPVFAAYDAEQTPLRAAVGYAGGMGGLLGQYTSTVQKGSLGGLLANLAGSAAAAYAGGGFGGGGGGLSALKSANKN